jgi:hypothetical protein
VIDSALRVPGETPGPLDTQRSLGEYHLVTTKVDVKLARSLYDNTETRYKLGAGFARPAINIPVGFMGVPRFKAASPDAQRRLDELAPTWSGDILRAHRALLRDGEILLRLRPGGRSPAYAALYSGNLPTVEVGYNTAGTFDLEFLEEDAGALKGVKVTHLTLVREGDRMVEKKIYEQIYPDRVVIEWENNYRPKRTAFNGLGFVPAIALRNDNEDHELHGKSELEPLEPYMRFYNDVMLHAGSASQLHSTAKLVIRAKNVSNFIKNNFTDAEIAEKTLKFKGKDVLFFETGLPDPTQTGSVPQEGADIVQAQVPLGDTNTLLEYIFLNIVDVSEVPEWAFGGAIASSKASVSEQSAPLVHKVKRKQTAVENTWALAAQMGLAIVNQRSSVKASWDELAHKDSKSEAEAIKTLTDALTALVDAKIVSIETAVATLRPYLPHLLEYIVERDGDEKDDEKSRIESEQAERSTAEADILNRLLNGDDGDNEDDRATGLAAVG